MVTWIVWDLPLYVWSKHAKATLRYIAPWRPQQMSILSILRYCDGKAYSHDCKAINFGALYLLFASVKFWFYFSNGKLTPLRKYFLQTFPSSLGVVNLNLSIYAVMMLARQLWTVRSLDDLHCSRMRASRFWWDMAQAKVMVLSWEIKVYITPEVLSIQHYDMVGSMQTYFVHICIQFDSDETWPIMFNV